MRIIILTSSLFGTASHHLDYLINHPKYEIAMVVYNDGRIHNKKKRLSKTFKKLLRIGIVGALNGLRMRRWYGKDILKYVKIDNLETKCFELNIPFYRTTAINGSITQDLFKRAKADVGISLGNGYISEKIYSLPKYGMINIHHEMLPHYQNAQSIIWQIYNGSILTGYTIHKLDKQIDTGDILFQESMPIILRKSLHDTVSYTYVQVLKKSAVGLNKVLENIEYYLSKASHQGVGTKYTTPTIWQYLRIVRQFKQLKNNSKIRE